MHSLYNKANCTGAPLSGSWQRTGCEKIAQSLSVSTVCSGTVIFLMKKK